MAKKIDESVVRQIKDILQSAGYRNPTSVDLENKTVFEKISTEEDFSHITDPLAKALLERSGMLSPEQGKKMLEVIEEGRE
ncbi:hypothetical protein ACE3NQ_20395 [Paenibacillus terreus]|uniref:Uncharacterized protein n=1 Tax=Paenibacillus terreus TaxID=1387834 RepID=A0ABV5BC49_9BACL